MKAPVPRIVIAGTNSGCGKTSVTCAVLQAMVNRGMRVGAFKCGPDYIDPMFHSRIIGAKSANLDGYFFSDNTLRYLLARNAVGCDVSVLEGVMGYYDGLTLDSPRASTYETAVVTVSPVVLVVSAAGAALSVLAVIQGFLDLYPGNRIRGVILNRCSPMTYPGLAKAIRQRFGDRIRPLGFLPNLPECTLGSRHLGLITAQEVENWKQIMASLAAQAEKSLDLAGILALAEAAEPITCREVLFPRQEPVRIGVAQDRAFCFYYGDNLEALREMGAEIVEFSPLEDSALPDNLDGLYLGGGYPELYTDQLSGNLSMRRSVGNALADGLPCIAECGGFMYLTQSIAGKPMVGFLPGDCYDNGKLTRFGYVTLTAREDNLLCKAGQSIAGHEFHRWDCTQPGSGFTAEKASGKQWKCAVATSCLYAGFPHFHFYANPDFARNFYDACRKERMRHAGNRQTCGH
ncbi:MAG: cobyrinate a,c-diamide synthase [Firmicutes bacterium]|nr:cobyrinate a,c-diamide synthase [Bacillota bacterium]